LAEIAQPADLERAMELEEALIIVGIFLGAAVLPAIVLAIRNRYRVGYLGNLLLEWLRLFFVLLLLAGIFVFGQLYVEQLHARFWFYFGIVYGAWVIGLLVGLSLQSWKAFTITSVFAVPMMIAAIVWLSVS
jgi:hypothetical protein